MTGLTTRRVIGKQAVSALCAVLVVSLLVCPTATAMTLTLTGRDSGRAVYLRTGDVVQITLQENQSTPYRWKFVARPSRRVLRLIKSVYVPSPAPADIVGRGGHRMLTFKAVGRGTTSLKLALAYVGTPMQIGGRFSLQVRPG